jgi:Na+/melibiose symporter-like transporter
MGKAVAATGLDVNPKKFRPLDYIKITIFGLALSALWGSLHSVIMPVRLLDFVAESQKNTYLGLLTFTGLILAMVIQPVAGAISDRSSFSWGRRRPYILLGGVLTLFFLFGIGYAQSYAALFAIYCLLQIASNTAQGPYQAFIPDLVAEEKRGLASGVKNLVEVVGGVAVLYFMGRFMSRYLTDGGSFWLWLALGALAIIWLGTMLATVLMVRERPGGGDSRFSLRPALSPSFKIEARTSRNFALFLVSRFLILIAFIILQRYALYFLMDVVGVTDPAAVTADLLIVVGVCSLAAAYPAGRLSDRVGRRLVIMASGLLGALGIVVLFFSSSYIQVMFCGALLGIAFGAFMSANWALATELVTKGGEARYLGLTNLATAGAGALVGLMGLVIDLSNADIPGLGYKIMLLACFVSFLVGSGVVMKIKERVNQGTV